jgi:homoserine dehydrogenase
MNTPLRIGIAGLGTVGAGALAIISQHASMIEERCGRKIVVAAVSARNRKKSRGTDIASFKWFDSPLAMAGDGGIDVIVEAIGGENGPARELVEAALKNGKSVVTANKALIAHHGMALARLSEKSGAVLAFEAAVAGGIPIIKSLRDGLAANRFTRIAGILSGTCNYILTSMWEEKRGFAEALKEAQEKGYAEAEPSFDIDAIDSAHKLAILAGLAYGAAPALERVYVEGIRGVTLRDMEFAAELGYVIKLLGIASLGENGLMQRVHPCMVPKDSQLGTVNGVHNAVLVEGDAVGEVLFEGRGAGAGPTASSIVADLMDIARGVKYPPFTLPLAALKSLPAAGMDRLTCAYYLRLGVTDRPGVLSEVTGIFKNQQISISSLLQHSHQPGDVVQVVITTHEAQEAAMLRAIRAIAELDSVHGVPYMIRIENL